MDDHSVHGHRSGATIDDIESVTARSQPGHREHRLLGLACTRGGQIHRPLCLAVDLDFDLPSSVRERFAEIEPKYMFHSADQLQP